MWTGVINMNDLSHFISTVGFPIVVSVAMFYQNNTLSSNYQSITQGLQEKLEANTLIMQKLIDSLSKDGFIKDVQNDTTNK